MQHQAKKTVTSRGFFDWLTLEVVSAADSPRPTRLHLEPKAERELAWAAMGCLPTAAISLRFSFDGTRGCGSGQWRRRFPGSFFILTPSRSPTWGEDGGGRSPRHPEEGGSFSGGSDMKGSSGPGEWTSPQQQQHTDVCQWWDLWRFLSRILIAFFLPGVMEGFEGGGRRCWKKVLRPRINQTRWKVEFCECHFKRQM